MNPGSNWGGQYSRWAFNEANQFVMVAKEIAVPSTGQPVPLLDEELNEQAEILFTMIRRSIERTYGSGSKGGGFQILQSSTNTVNNFTIQGGNGTVDGAGFLFVQGWHVINLSNVDYGNQTVYPGVAYSTVSGNATLTAPVANRTDQVYVDVFYSEIGPSQAGNLNPSFPLVDPKIGFETSRRLQLCWQVCVAEGASTPANYIDTYGVQHWTLQIATINRLAGNTNILTSMIVDTRNSTQQMSSLYHQTSGSSLWTINHNLNANVGVRTFLNNGAGTAPGAEIEPGLITITNLNSLTIDFDGISVAGWAYIKTLS